MSREGSRGIVLVAVLFAVAVMSVLVVAVTSLTRSGIAGSGLEARRLATDLALRSGVESAKALIVAERPEQRVLFDGTPVMMDLGDGLQAEVTIRDAAGLVDLNRTEIPLVGSVLRASLDAAEAAELSARIGDLRMQAEDEAKAKVTDPSPAPAPDPNTEQREEKGPAPVVFVSVDQLLAMAEPGSGELLSNLFTVFNPTGQLNLLAAPDDVLLAIPGFTPGDLAAIRSARKDRRLNGDLSLQQLRERLRPFVGEHEPSVFVVGIRLTAGPRIIAQSRASAVVQLVDQGPLPFRTLAVSGL